MSLVGHWPLHERSGQANDLSENDNHGTVNGATQGVAGVGGLSAYSFVVSDDWVNLGTALNFGSTDFTISVWVRVRSTGSLNVILSDYDGSSPHYNLGVVGSTGATEMYGVDSNGDKFDADGGRNIVDGEWHHLVGQRKGDTVYVYVDGQLDSQDTNTSVGSIDSSSADNIGARNGGGQDFIDADIADLRVYNRALA